MATHITDLPVDVVSRILSVVAKGPEGAEDIAKSMPTCKIFLEASKSPVVKKSVCFDHAQILNRTHFFLNTNGLLAFLYMCVKSHNPSAEFQLAQLILTTSTQLVELGWAWLGPIIFPTYCHRDRGEARDERVLIEFLTHFIPGPGTYATPLQESNPRPLLYHWEFVRAFLFKATAADIICMSPHVGNYIQLFSGWQFKEVDVCRFLYTIKFWINVGSTYSETITLTSGGLNWFEYVRDLVISEFEVIIPKLTWPRD